VNYAKKARSNGNQKPGQLPGNGTEGNMRAIAGGIAHDLNTILTVIYGYCEMALESTGESTVTEHHIQRIIHATDRAKILAEELIDLSRDLVQKTEETRVGEILSDTLNFFKPSLPDIIVITENMITPDICVEAVPAQLFRVFMNLSSNAIKAMEDTGGTLTVTLDSEREPDNQSARVCDRAHIRFEDTGKGMDEETARKAVSPFFTSDRKGTGLGLAVVNEIINTMDGAMEISSEPGRGTVIDVFIPALSFGLVGEKI
jgi:two-component system cell cycle sensor histidine kinase/response regulator CckA